MFKLEMSDAIKLPLRSDDTPWGDRWVSEPETVRYDYRYYRLPIGEVDICDELLK